MPFRSYIKIPRELFSSAEWSARRKFSRFEAMLDLLRSAAYADGFVVCCATRDVVLRRGQLLTTQRDLAERWGVSAATVNRYLQLWRNTRRNSIRIEIETTIETNKTLITICNYDEWDFSIRDGETLDETASETRHETQPETHIELNKNKNKLTTSYAPAREAENSEHSEQTRPADPKEKSCAKKEIGPAPAAQFIPVALVAEYLKSDPYWLETLCMNRHLEMNFVMSKIDEFQKELQNQGETTKDKRDCKRHFNNWLRKNREPHEPTTNTNRGAAPEITNDEIDLHCANRVARRLARAGSCKVGL